MLRGGLSPSFIKQTKICDILWISSQTTIVLGLATTLSIIRHVWEFEEEGERLLLPTFQHSDSKEILKTLNSTDMRVVTRTGKERLRPSSFP